MKNQVPETILTGIVETEKEAGPKVETEPSSEFELLRKKFLAGRIDSDGKPCMVWGKMPLPVTADSVRSTRKVEGVE